MLNVPFYRTAAGQRSFLFREVKLWNELPAGIKYIDNFKNFKVNLKSMLLGECWIM